MWNNPEAASEYQFGWGDKKIVCKALQQIITWQAERVIEKFVRRGLFFFCLTTISFSCAYMHSLSNQGQYARTQETNPGLHNLKHIMNQDTFFVYGLILNDTQQFTDQPLLVAAYR